MRATTTKRLLGSATTLAIGVMFLGCGGLFTKESYFDEKKKSAVEVELTGANYEREFLGIRTRSGEQPYQLGVAVLHVFPESPAAACGLQQGDEIRSIGENTTRTAAELRGFLSQKGNAVPSAPPPEPAPGAKKKPPAGDRIVYARGGQEYSAELKLETYGQWIRKRREKVLSDAQLDEVEIPLIFEKHLRELQPSFIEAWFGVSVEDAVVLYRDTDILPLVLGISLLRWESLPVFDGGRYLFVWWPLRFSTSGEDKSYDLRGLIPPAPEGTEDL